MEELTQKDKQLIYNRRWREKVKIRNTGKPLRPYMKLVFNPPKESNILIIDDTTSEEKLLKLENKLKSYDNILNDNYLNIIVEEFEKINKYDENMNIFERINWLEKLIEQIKNEVNKIL